MMDRRNAAVLTLCVALLHGGITAFDFRSGRARFWAPVQFGGAYSFDREAQPQKFWITVAFNTALTTFFVLVASLMLIFP